MNVSVDDHIISVDISEPEVDVFEALSLLHLILIKLLELMALDQGS